MSSLAGCRSIPLIDKNLTVFLVRHSETLEEARDRTRKGFPERNADRELPNIRNIDLAGKRHVPISCLVEFELHGMVFDQVCVPVAVSDVAAGEARETTGSPHC